MTNIYDYSKSFLIGGLTVVIVKYISNVIGDPLLASVFGSFPVGFFAIYFLSSSDTKRYIKAYGLMEMVLLMSIFLFYIIFNYLQINKNISYYFSILFYYLVIIIIIILYKLNYIHL